MAFGIGSLVLRKFVSADLPGTLNTADDNSEPPHFGVVAVLSPPTILWDNGQVSTHTGTPPGSVDDLYSVSANTRTLLSGKVVREANQTPERQGIVVALYRRAAANGTELALVRALSTGVFREVAAANLAAVPGR